MNLEIKQLKKQLIGFRDRFKKYQGICQEIWKAKNSYDTNKISKLRREEAVLREELTEMWGRLEKYYKKLGIPIIGSAYNRQFYIFDQALDSVIFDNPVKGSSLAMAVQSAIKAVGVAESFDEIELSEDVKFHPRIEAGCIKLFKDGHYTEAVEKSFKIVKDRLRELTGFEKASDAFGKGKLYIRGASAPHVDEDFNTGVKFLCMAIDRFRNEKAHFADSKIVDAKRAQSYLELSSLVMYFLDEAESKQDQE